MKKIWKWVLIIFIIVLAFFFPAILLALGELLLASWPLIANVLIGLAASLPWWAGAAIGIGLAYLVDPETTTEIAEDIGGAVGTISGAVIGGAATGIFGGSSSLLLLGAAALGIFFLTRDESEEDKKKRIEKERRAAAANLAATDPGLMGPPQLQQGAT